jgi:SAM-dependent methyltransferase
VSAPDPALDRGATEADHALDAGKLYGRWYYESYTVPYEQNAHWSAFFGQLADRIVAELAPRRTLDAGCARGFLVAKLRDRGVEAYGFDISEVALSDVPDSARPYVKVGSLAEPIEGRYDLVTCIEVIEHLDPADAATAVGNLCRAADAVLLSSTPGDLDEPTHVNVQPPERWSQLFALHGFYRDFRHDAGYLSPWAALYRKGEPSVPELVLDYDRAWSQLRTETLEQRRALLSMQERFEQLEAKPDNAEFERLHAHLEDLNKEILRLRDAVIGKEAELATALGRVEELEVAIGRYANLEERLDAVLSSNSWKVAWAAGLPVRMLRERKGQ